MSRLPVWEEVDGDVVFGALLESLRVRGLGIRLVMLFWVKRSRIFCFSDSASFPPVPTPVRAAGMPFVSLLLPWVVLCPLARFVPTVQLVVGVLVGDALGPALVVWHPVLRPSLSLLIRPVGLLVPGSVAAVSSVVVEVRWVSVPFGDRLIPDHLD